jgi:N-acylneuraminate cytidylyltransferase
VPRRIAVIPARGGSKRIPRKNVVPFCGKPMIAWTIDAAHESGCFDHVIVSTEDDEIATIAKKYGAAVPFRRPSHFDDQSNVSAAVGVTLALAEQHWQTEFDHVVLLMANCPLRTSADIRDAVAHFDANDHAFQISVSRFGWLNPWWAIQLNDSNRGEPLFRDALRARSQDLGTLYCPSGAVWMARVPEFKAAATFYGEDVRFLPIDWMSAVDIDDVADLQFAEAIFLYRQSLHERLHTVPADALSPS